MNKHAVIFVVVFASQSIFYAITKKKKKKDKRISSVKFLFIIKLTKLWLISKTK